MVQVRDAKAEGGGDVAPIPVTVRQLEALVRISEALARMELSTLVGARHVQASIDLFGASTLDAVRSGMTQALVLSDEQVRPSLPAARAVHWEPVQCRFVHAPQTQRPAGHAERKAWCRLRRPRYAQRGAGRGRL